MKSLPFLGSCSYITTYYHPKRYKSRGANNVFILHAYRPFWHFFPQRSDLAIQDLEFQSLILIYKPELQVGVGSPSFLLSKNILQLSKLVGRPWLTKSISAKMVRMVRTAIFWVSACLFFAMAVIDMVDFFLYYLINSDIFWSTKNTKHMLPCCSPTGERDRVGDTGRPRSRRSSCSCRICWIVGEDSFGCIGWWSRGSRGGTGKDCRDCCSFTTYWKCCYRIQKARRDQRIRFKIRWSR